MAQQVIVSSCRQCSGFASGFAADLMVLKNLPLDGYFYVRLGNFIVVTAYSLSFIIIVTDINITAVIVTVIIIVIIIKRCYYYCYSKSIFWF